MKKAIFLAAFATFASCKAPQFVQAGQKNGVDVSYRWKHISGQPSELLLKLTNHSASNQQVHLEMDLYYQAFTVEQFLADTCIPPGRTFNGKTNGFWFIARQLKPEQAASADTKVELTNFTAEPVETCK